MLTEELNYFIENQQELYTQFPEKCLIIQNQKNDKKFLQGEIVNEASKIDEIKQKNGNFDFSLKKSRAYCFFIFLCNSIIPLR